MTDALTDAVSPDRALGRLEGRVVSLEDRVTRNEGTTDTRLTSIEDKLDQVADAIARGYGGLKTAHWTAGIAVMIALALLAHFWPAK